MSLNGGLFPTTDEPERGPGRGSSEDGRDARHPSPADAGTGSRVPGRQPADRPAGPDPRGGLRLRRPDRASVRLHPSREDGKGGAPTLPGQGHRPVARPTHPAPDPTPDHGRGRGSSRRPAAAVSAPLHEHRHRATRRGRALHGTLSGPATRKLCARAYPLFDDRRFERLARISNGHLYNLRHSTTYQRRRGATPVSTRPVPVAIGERRRPQPFGQPGYVRVESIRFIRATAMASRACTT